LPGPKDIAGDKTNNGESSPMTLMGIDDDADGDHHQRREWECGRE